MDRFARSSRPEYTGSETTANAVGALGAAGGSAGSEAGGLGATSPALAKTALRPRRQHRPTSPIIDARTPELEGELMMACPLCRQTMMAEPTYYRCSCCGYRDACSL